ncbi:hypothetical protein K504DRAFT_492381 [Pleomassaria siparia CBS 279.74]|uniref:Uncharacterized protein n=1 Tax=Pleomassaria siparia CBS 279.74 TaxID=1314801 RepID=A0A6G1K4Q9_9PLEO|nr:hypothetical protein K504DRAFT_492381 [Pleomassaria siparia CBS 279.74]
MNRERYKRRPISGDVVYAWQGRRLSRELAVGSGGGGWKRLPSERRGLYIELVSFLGFPKYVQAIEGETNAYAFKQNRDAHHNAVVRGEDTWTEHLRLINDDDDNEGEEESEDGEYEIGPPTLDFYGQQLNKKYSVTASEKSFRLIPLTAQLSSTRAYFGVDRRRTCIHSRIMTWEKPLTALSATSSTNTNSNPSTARQFLTRSITYSDLSARLTRGDQPTSDDTPCKWACCGAT